jgi:preprotein translocase subunit SecA
MADRLQRDRDYLLVRERRAIVFLPGAIQLIKQASGWEYIAPAKGVAFAHEVERNILEREGLIPAADRQTLADITVQGFVRLYRLLGGLSAGGNSQEEVLAQLYGFQDDARRSPARLMPRLRHGRQRPSESLVASERIIDAQRSSAYAVRARVRDAVAVDSAAVEAVYEVTRTSADRPDLETALARILITDVESIHPHFESLGANVAADFERQLASLGPLGIWELARQAQLAYFDLNWRIHLARLRFLQRNAGSLYVSAADAKTSFAGDARGLFDDFWRKLYSETLNHLLGH